eukprot:2226646-Amphidinium_carterae.1
MRSRHEQPHLRRFNLLRQLFWASSVSGCSLPTFQHHPTKDLRTCHHSRNDVQELDVAQQDKAETSSELTSIPHSELHC